MILVVGDPHFKPNNKLETELLLADVLSIIRTRDVDFVILMGDILDNHEKIDLKCFKRAENFIAAVSELKPLYILIGNHDRANNKVFMTDEHVFGPYKRWHNVHIVDDHCETLTWREKRICMVPYVPNGMFMKALEHCSLDVYDFDLFFGHSEFQGCSINKLSQNKCDVWDESYPMNIQGHIHSFEVVGNNLVYVGTPFQQTFGESHENKGVFLIDEDLGLELIELNIPKKVTKRINYTEISSVEINPSEKTRLIITGPKTMIKEILLTPEYQQKFKDVKIVFNDVKTKKKSKFEFRTNMSFMDRLASELSKNVEMDNSFKKFFQKT